MNIVLWIIAGFLATGFLFAGTTKLLFTREKLASSPGGGWAMQFSPRFIKTLGVLEILGAVGLILPAALDIAPILVPLAAVGLAIVMIGGSVVVYRRHDYRTVAVNTTYMALALFVAFGRA
ncbi:DoxX family protein [Actinoplanes sp. TBRC 11911]|uniref:DoxX family protein n=1 Tax=Actinoplanes sp. TBRC 11911 TaxID=2729386 RepID=UPI00145E74E1|nr:DoxX family protein [Actinoplanes sp. TBRC 11911]NMO57574.1 DoxX family protein [Actinoplanes sp. TBRC 11911]